MNHPSPQTIEACRLVRKFYPESKATIQAERPFGAYDLVTAMSWGADYHVDFSCEAVPHLKNPPDLGLAARGGVCDDDDDAIYVRLLAHTCFSPTGRVVIFPDDWPREEREPFVCHSRTAIERIREFGINSQSTTPCFFDNCSDIMFVYESGEAMILDHDQRFFWSRSKLRDWAEHAA